MTSHTQILGTRDIMDNNNDEDDGNYYNNEEGYYRPVRSKHYYYTSIADEFDEDPVYSDSWLPRNNFAFVVTIFAIGLLQFQGL